MIPGFCFFDRKNIQATIRLHQVSCHEDQQNTFHAVKRESFRRFISDNVWNTGRKSFRLYRLISVLAHRINFSRVSFVPFFVPTPNQDRSKFHDQQNLDQFFQPCPLFDMVLNFLEFPMSKVQGYQLRVKLKNRSQPPVEIPIRWKTKWRWQR